MQNQGVECVDSTFSDGVTKVCIYASLFCSETSQDLVWDCPQQEDVSHANCGHLKIYTDACGSGGSETWGTVVSGKDPEGETDTFYACKDNGRCIAERQLG